MSRSISCLADIERHIKEHRLGFATMLTGKPQPLTTIRDSQIRGVDVRYRSLQTQPRIDQVTQGGKHLRMDRLIRFIVGQLQAKRVARNCVCAELPKPGRLAGTRQADRDREAHLDNVTAGIEQARGDLLPQTDRINRIEPGKTPEDGCIGA